MIRKSINPKTLKALIAIGLALSASEMTLCFGSGGPEDHLTCPDCGAPATWEDCKYCEGTGLITCFCEAEGGNIICSRDCFTEGCNEDSKGESFA